ncbi:MAG: haloacid dehalogenase type II [Acidimicrobiia bacterium]
MAPIVLFDVNETLIDLAPLRSEFAERFDGEIDVARWFSELLRLSFVYAATGAYAPFTKLAGNALVSVGAASGIHVGPEDVAFVGARFRTLPAHPDAKLGLDALANNGAVVVAITNSPLDVANDQLTNAGLSQPFDRILSVEAVRRFKPHASVYAYAANEVGADAIDCVMVAAHDWDIAGAMIAGCTGVYIDRTGRPWTDAFAPPDRTATGIDEAAEWITRR